MLRCAVVEDEILIRKNMILKSRGRPETAEMHLLTSENGRWTWS